MKNYNEVVLVGGPFAGMVVSIPEDLRVLSMAHWSSPWSMLRKSLFKGKPVVYDDPLRLEEYRWVNHKMVGPSLIIECVAAVHESIQNYDDVVRCVMGMAMTHTLLEGLKKY